MRGKREEINLILNQILDALLIAMSFLIAYKLRYFLLDEFLQRWSDVQFPLSDFVWMIAVAALFAPLILEYYGFYRHPLEKGVFTSVLQMLRAALVITLIIGFGIIFLRQQSQSRFLLLSAGGISMLLLLLKEFFVRLYLRRKLKKLDFRERTLLAGSMEEIEQLIEGLGKEFSSDNHIVGMIDLSKKGIEALVDCLHRESVSRVIFAAGHIHFTRIEEALLACEEEGVESWLSTDFMNTTLTRPKFDVLAGRPMLVFRSTPEHSWELLVKSLLDRIGALALIILSSPLWLLAILGIKISSPKGPIFFRQKRSGRYGKEFMMMKFRSMSPDAEARQKELEEVNVMSGPVFKVQNDPRVFPFGKFMRRTSIDELPQLLNVLAGEMSLVGPRPLPTYEIEKIDKPSQRRRLSVKPGLTCIWQISGRNKISKFEDWVKLDLSYIDNWSIWLDIKILFKTIPAVFKGG